MKTQALNVIAVADAKARGDDLIARVIDGEEWLIIDTAGRTVAKLEPVPKNSPSEVRRWKAFGMMKGQIKIAPDFDDPLVDFKPYTE